MREKKYLTVIVWVIILISVILMSIGQKWGVQRFFGIAEARETIISNENPVQLKSIRVVPGMVIKNGDTLAVLHRQDLTLKINEITHQLEQLRVEGVADMTGLRAGIGKLMAMKAQKSSEINNRIVQLRAQYSMNKKLSADLKSIEKKEPQAGADSLSPLAMQIRGLESELETALRPLDIEISVLESAIRSPQTAVKVQVERLERELALLEQEKNALFIFSPIDGLVGSVNYREGETISPYDTILTIHSRTPSLIKGYIHENVYNRIATGETVDVISMADKRNRIYGTVVGVGARIVEYPIRLRKRQDIQIWGREVIIQIPENNPFLLGERVSVTPAKNRGGGK